MVGGYILSDCVLYGSSVLFSVYVIKKYIASYYRRTYLDGIAAVNWTFVETIDDEYIATMSYDTGKYVLLYI